MSDPLSVAGSAVGIISLSITVAQGLYDYYSALQDQKSDIAHTTRKLSRLLEILDSLRRTLEQRQFPADDHRLTTINFSVKDCEELIRELQEELDKFNHKPHRGVTEGLRTAGRRIAYPLRQSTLQKLDENVDDVISTLSLALQALQQSDICGIQDGIEDTHALLELTRASQLSAEIKAWLMAPDATINFNDALKMKHSRTGFWFVEGLEFEEWLEKPASFLWLVGFAGCGKSVLCSTAIQHTFRHRRSNPHIGIAFFYFTFNDETKQDTSAMLRALVLQLSSQFDNKYTYLSLLYDRYRNATPPDSVLMACLRQLVQAFKQVYILLDALDESPRDKHREAMLGALADIRSWSEPGLHILVSSRDEPDIREELEVLPKDIVKVQNGSHDRDIALFISQNLQDNRRLRRWHEYHTQIEATLTARAQGVFRWVECQFKALANCPQSEDLLERLLESLPPTLDKTYERILTNIPSASRDYARQMLILLCCARRPLTVAELTDGIAVELGDTPRFNSKRKIRDINSVQQICPGLVELDERHHTQNTIVRIAHFSVREYLESKQIMDCEGAALFSVRREQADCQMACICLAVLLELQLPISAPPALLKQDNSTLTQYAARYWPEHFGDGEENPQTQDQVLQLFSDTAGLFERWVATWNVDSYDGGLDGDAPSPIYYASLMGFNSILLQLLIDHNTDVNAQGGEYGSALQAGSAGGHDNIVQLLIDHNADVNARGGLYGSPLVAASGNGHDNIVQLLIDHNADVNAQNGRFGTALQAASEGGYDNIAQLLIDHNADVNAQGGYHGTALAAASAGGHDNIIQLLIHYNAYINAQDGHYGSALQAASAGGYGNIVQLLIDHNANINAQGGLYKSALVATSVGGHEDIVQLLINHNADVNAQGGLYGSPLAAASADGHDNIVQLLIDHNADVNAQDGHYGSALQAASAGGHGNIIQLLIDHNADVNAQGGHYGSSLQAASARGHGNIVQLLIDRNADVNAQGGHYGSALQAASARGHDNIIQLLIDHNADVNAQGGHYGSALAAASAHGHDNIAQLLIDRNADVNARGGLYGSPLVAASADGHDNIVQLLIDYNADVDAHNGRFGTALYAASEVGYDNIVQLLIDHNADVNAQGRHYGSALSAASAGGHDNIVQLLIDYNADINAQDRRFGTALCAASEVGYDNIVQLLIDHNADVNAQDWHYGSALQAASAGGHDNIVQLLIDHNADVNAQDGFYGSALVVASEGGHDNIVQLLIDHNADVNAQDGRFGTALQAASEGGHNNIVQLLIDHNANVNAQGGHYGSALAAASAHGHDNIAQLLIDRNADVNSRGGLYGSPQVVASADGHDNIVPLLIDHNVDLCILNNGNKDMEVPC